MTVHPPVAPTCAPWCSRRHSRWDEVGPVDANRECRTLIGRIGWQTVAVARSSTWSARHGLDLGSVVIRIEADPAATDPAEAVLTADEASSLANALNAACQLVRQWGA